MTKITQNLLKIGGGSLTALLVLTGAQPANAILLNLSYTLELGEVLTGVVDGDIQGDNDTVIVNSITDLTFSGSAAPALPFVESAIEFFTGGAIPGEPTLSLSGTTLDFIACPDATCNDGFLFETSGLVVGSPAYISGSSFGNAFELYNQANYSLTPVPFEAEGTMGLVALGGYLFYRKKRQQENN